MYLFGSVFTPFKGSTILSRIHGRHQDCLQEKLATCGKLCEKISIWQLQPLHCIKYLLEEKQKFMMKLFNLKHIHFPNRHQWYDEKNKTKDNTSSKPITAWSYDMGGHACRDDHQFAQPKVSTIQETWHQCVRRSYEKNDCTWLTLVNSICFGWWTCWYVQSQSVRRSYSARVPRSSLASAQGICPPHPGRWSWWAGGRTGW